LCYIFFIGDYNQGISLHNAIPRSRLHKTPEQGALTQIEVSLIEEKNQD